MQQYWLDHASAVYGFTSRDPLPDASSLVGRWCTKRCCNRFNPLRTSCCHTLFWWWNPWQWQKSLTVRCCRWHWAQKFSSLLLLLRNQPNQKSLEFTIVLITSHQSSLTSHVSVEPKCAEVVMSSCFLSMSKYDVSQLSPLRHWCFFCCYFR